MVRFVWKYLPFGLVLPFGYLGLYMQMGGHFTPWLWVWGALAGILGLALVYVAINGRYVLANRAEEKARRRRAQGRQEREKPPGLRP